MLSEETLPQIRETVEKYPFYQTARILYLTNLFNLQHPDFAPELKKASVFIADRSALFKLVEGTRYELKIEPEPAGEIETETNHGRTVAYIDSFLQQSKLKETDKQQPSIADLTNDYAAFLETMDDIQPGSDSAATDDVPKLKGSELIDEFIETSKGRQRFEFGELSDEYTSPEITYEEEEVYTTNMVNIYIKQGRYKEALEILRKICLNNPEKNTTFAPQIQLLEVIIGNKA